MTLDQYLLGLIIWIVAAGTIMMGLSFPANMFIALKSPPTQRAMRVAGTLYVAVTVIFLFGGMPEYLLVSPLIPALGALIVFWFWRREYRKAWIEDADVDDTVTLENDDWKAGLIKLFGLLVTATIAAFIRRSLHH